MNEAPIGERHADLSFMKIYAGGNPELIRQVVNRFIESTPASLSEMEAAAAQQDYSLLSRIAHSLKSQISYMGAKKANELAVKIEHDSKEMNQVELLPEKISSLKGMLEQAYLDLKQQLQEL